MITLPLDIYQGYFREHQYGMANQTFVPWAVEQLVLFLVQTVVFALAVAVLYAVIRRAGERWSMWGTVAAVALMVAATMAGPVLIDPLTNTYRPVTDPTVKSAVLAMAHADEVPVDNVYEFDASKQTTRVSANVSGIFGTAAVRLNDNLLKTSLPEIRAVMGHELGHYVMNHIYKGIAEFAILIFFGFLFAKWAMDALLLRYGAGWGLRGVADVASFPLFIAVLSVFFLVATPISNTLIRTQEIEADRFGLNLSREPNGEAEADLKLTEYRKPDRARSRSSCSSTTRAPAIACTTRCSGARRWARRDGGLRELSHVFPSTTSTATAARPLNCRAWASHRPASLFASPIP